VPISGVGRGVSLRFRRGMPKLPWIRDVWTSRLLSGICIRPRERIISPGRKKYRHESENGGGNDGAGPGGVFGSMRQHYYVQHWCLTSTGLTHALVALSISIPYTIHGIDWTGNIIKLPSRTADIYQVSCPKRLSACVPIVRKILRELLMGLA
jgi:hypothetical protein